FQVTDNVSNCVAYFEETTTAISAMTLSVTPTNVQCNGADDGLVDFEVFDYDPAATDLTYTVVDQLTGIAVGTLGSAGTIVGPLAAPGTGETGTATNLPPGTYTLIIEEVGGTQCTVAENFFISEPTPIGINLVSNVNANCNIGAQVTVDGVGGTPPYEFAFVVDGAAAAGYTSSASATLDPATSLLWDVYVRDANNCEVTPPLDVTIVVDPSPVITANLVDNCATEGNFEILVERTPAAPT